MVGRRVDFGFWISATADKLDFGFLSDFGLCIPDLLLRRCRSSIVRRQSSSAQVIVEYAIVFPILLLVTLLIIQLAHLFVAKQVVSYASYCAARAALVDSDPQEAQSDANLAAQIVCSSIAGPSGVGSDSTVTLPGWGALPGSGASAAKTKVIITNGDSSLTADVTHYYELTIPVANTVTYQLGDVLLTSNDVDRDKFGAPHMPITGTCTLSKTWK